MKALDLERVTRAMLAANLRRPRWTAADDAVLREHYHRRGPAWCAVRVGRSRHATHQRARVLGLAIKSVWSDAELGVLRREWGEMAERGLRAKLPGRTWAGIAHQAKALGLARPTQGTVTIEAAVQRTGVSRDRLLSVLAAAGVSVHKHVRAAPPRRSRRKHPHRRVDLDAAVAAVEAWLTRGAVRLTCVEAAALCRVDRTTMNEAFAALAAVRPVEGMLPHRPWSVTAEDAVEALALYRVRQAEARAARIAAGRHR